MSFATPQPEKGFGMDFGALPPEMAAATPYVAWLSQAAARAEQAGMQAAAARGGL